MPYAVIFALIYLIGQLAFWRIILKPHKREQHSEST